MQADEFLFNRQKITERFTVKRNAFFWLMIVILTVISPQATAQETQQQNPADLKKLSMEELMNVEVTSVSKRPEKLTQAASAIQVITREDIIRSGATSVPEVLRLAPNLQVAQVNASQWAISARGFNNVLANKLLVLIDGRVVYTPMYAGVFWDVQNLLLEDIERIEVISGPGGTLWGANAVNGVINIITRNARDTKGLYIEAATGTELPALASLRYGAALSDNVSFRIYGTTFRQDNTIFQDSIDAEDDWQMAQGGARLDWRTSEKDSVTFLYNLYDGRPDPDGDQPVIASGNNILVRWGHKTSETSGFQIQAYYDKTWRDFNNGFTEKLMTYDFEAQHHLKIGRRQEFIYGLGVRVMDHNVENLELFAFRPAHKKLYLYNVFVQDEIALVPEKVKLTLGLKVEHNSYTQYQYQPNAKIAWMPLQDQTIWASVSRAVRNPSRIDREFYLDLAPGIPFIAGGDFQSEELLAYELGWRKQIKTNLSISVATFYNEYDNIRSVEPGPAPFGIPITFGNGVKGTSHGVEFSANYQPNDWWYLRGGYTYFNKDLLVKQGSADQNNGSDDSNDPKHQALIQSAMQFSETISLTTVLRYVGELPDPDVSDYVGLDIRLAWRVNKTIEFMVVGQDLLQDHHTEFIPASPPAKDIERSIYGKIACRF